MEKLDSAKFKALSNYQQRLILGGESTCSCNTPTYYTDGHNYSQLGDSRTEVWTDMNTLVKVTVCSK